MRNYLWFDTEFTDLDLEKARLLQVALIITDSDLNRVLAPDRDMNICIKMEDDAGISPWVRENLSDLLAACRSEDAVPVEEVDNRLAALIDEVAGPPSKETDQRPVLAGNSVHADYYMARKHLPQFARRIHYRLMDVSTLKLLWEDWHSGKEFNKDDPELIKEYFTGSGEELEGKPHDAYYDIIASMAELNYYRTRMNLKPSN